MAKKKPPKESIHLSIGKDLMGKLREFSSNRGNTMTDSVTYALDKLFTYESMHPLREEIMQDVISRKFSVPTAFTLRGFWLFLYMLSEKYGNNSSRDFWGETIYLSGIDKTNKEVFTEIYDECGRLLKVAWEKKKI